MFQMGKHVSFKEPYKKKQLKAQEADDSLVEPPRNNSNQRVMRRTPSGEM